LQVGDDEAAVGALGSGLDAGDDAALDVPACRGVAKLAVAADFVGIAIEPAESSARWLTRRSSTELPARPKM